MKKRVLARLLGVLLCLAVLPASAYAAQFYDLPEGNWAYPYASELVDRGVMNDNGSGYFNPEMLTSRGEFVLYLWRAMERPQVNAPVSSFDDIHPTSPYVEAVEWAYINGITNGKDERNFGPDDPLTREQAFTFLYRAMCDMGMEPVNDTATRTLTDFNDYRAVSNWATAPIEALLGTGIVKGSDGNVNPGGNLENAQTASLLFNAMVYMGLIPAYG